LVIDACIEGEPQREFGNQWKSLYFVIYLKKIICSMNSSDELSDNFLPLPLSINQS